MQGGFTREERGGQAAECQVFTGYKVEGGDATERKAFCVSCDEGKDPGYRERAKGGNEKA